MLRPYEVKVAFRYLTSSRLQTFLILAGVAVGIVAYTFMAALINGLALRLTDDVIGNLAHVTLEPRELEPGVIADPLPGLDRPGRILVAVQRSGERRPKIEGWRRQAELLAEHPGVTAVLPLVTGNGFFQRGEKIRAVGIYGAEPGSASSIIDFAGSLVRGSAGLGPGDVLIGELLAAELGVTTGQVLRLRSERGRERTLQVRGIFDVGSASANERLAVMELRTAQSLLELEGAVSRLEVTLADIYEAPGEAKRLAALTGLEAKDWIAENSRLQEALRAQGSTGDLIKFFSLLTIIVGVASVLLLAGVRRRPEIGIMRSMGVGRASVRRIFQLQGLIIGLLGSSAGALGGYLFCLFLLAVTQRPDGTSLLPVAPAEGEYGNAILFATLASTVASILPARAAARIDPVEAIQQ